MTSDVQAAEQAFRYGALGMWSTTKQFHGVGRVGKFAGCDADGGQRRPREFAHRAMPRSRRCAPYGASMADNSMALLQWLEHVGVMAVGAAVPACAIGLRYGVRRAASVPNSAMARIAGSVTLVRMSTRGSSTRSFRRKPMITGVAESAPAAFMGPRLRGDEKGVSSSSPHPRAPQGAKPPLQLGCVEQRDAEQHAAGDDVVHVGRHA